ncbi:MAG: DUF2437 domain-containing protein [Candidatus Omnitrophica bacterium]|nr:DUF2437 domain-containing protein [Candidatus Omnitrophota bacterium]MBD3269422.1 DUF2437 domain-containing protein [Candidatus Omnitrophota bacterium]
MLCLARVLYKNKDYWAAVEGESLRLLKNSPYEEIRVSDKRIKLKRHKLLPPAEPTKIICVGLNYTDHAKELKMRKPRQPIIFLKPPGSLIADGEIINYPGGCRRVDYEAELALVVKKKGKNIPAAKAGEYILGFTCLNDVTARDLQKKDGQWTRAKSFDTFCPLGPWVVRGLSPGNLKITSFLNGKLKQNSSTSLFIFNIGYLINFISSVMTILPGDVISTGTPAGVGPMKRGDSVKVSIEGIGDLCNRIE